VLSCLEQTRPLPEAETLGEMYRVMGEAYARMGCRKDAVAAALLGVEVCPEECQRQGPPGAAPHGSWPRRGPGEAARS